MPIPLTLTITAKDEAEAKRVAEVLCKSQGLPVTEQNTQKVFAGLCNATFQQLARQQRGEEVAVTSAAGFSFT